MSLRWRGGGGGWRTPSDGRRPGRRGCCLTCRERTRSFVQLGCGEHYLAAERILAAVAREGFPLPAALLTMVTTWLDR
jgi:hypothetical protein